MRSWTGRLRNRPWCIPIFSSLSRWRERVQCWPAPVGCLWLATESLWQCRRSADLQRDRTGEGEEWETEMDTFPLGLSGVSAAKFSRMGRSLDFAVRVGSSLLPATARSGQPSPRSGESIGFQMAAHPVLLLERSRYL